MILWVALGGAVGSAARHSMNLACARLCGTAFPWATLAVNVLGCFAMGLLVSMLGEKLSLSPGWRAFLTTGVLGGFTTFSAFSLDVALLMERGEGALAAAYVLASVGLSLGAILVGFWLARVVLS